MKFKITESDWLHYLIMLIGIILMVVNMKNYWESLVKFLLYFFGLLITCLGLLLKLHDE